MKTWQKRLLWCLGGLVALVMVGIGLVIWKFDFLMQTAICSALSRGLGAPVEMDGFHLSPANSSVQWVGVRLYNPPGFGPGPWLSIPELYLQAQAGSPSSNPFSSNTISIPTNVAAAHWREIRLNLAELAIVVNEQGQTNVTELMNSLSQRRSDVGSVTNLLSDFRFGGIDRLVLSLGRLRYVDLRNPTSTQELVFGLTNRVYTNLVSIDDFQPIAGEIVMRGALGLLARPSGSPLPQLLQRWTRSNPILNSHGPSSGSKPSSGH